MLDGQSKSLSDLPYLHPTDIENRAWTRALLAAAVLSDPAFQWRGIIVEAGPGPVRDAWLDYLADLTGPQRRFRRLPANTPPARLDPTLDLEASITAGKPMRQAGILDENEDTCLVVPMAERLAPALVGRLAQAMDNSAGPNLIFLCEADDEEDSMALALQDRCVLHVNLRTVSLRDALFTPAIARPAEPESDVIVSEKLYAAAANAAAEFGAPGARKAQAVMRTLRALATHDNAAFAELHHLSQALELVFGITIAADPPQPDSAENEAPPDQPPENGPDDGDHEQTQDEQPLDLAALQELLIAVKAAAAPLEALRMTQQAANTNRSSALGKAGAARKNAQRGRPVGTTERPAFDGQRPDVIATLRNAAPWQRIRAKARGRDWQPGQPLHVSRSDFRFKRLEHPTETTVIFAVDASGSTALERLGEAKGCIEILLGRCYVRRDQVALVSFRGERAEILLEPTRSLVRAKKSLAALPGGGPTPLADALQKANMLAHRARARGQQPFLVFLTDGRGNIAIDGTADKEAARDDALNAARQCASAGFRALIIDIARRPRPAAAQLAEALHADYSTLPRADAETMSELIGHYVEKNG
ncbi:MAG: VWA domain-containing protein [Pseudomonadota bacterium]